MANKYAKAVEAAQRLERQGHYGPDMFFDADEEWQKDPHIKNFDRAVAAAQLPGLMDNIRARRAALAEQRKANANAEAEKLQEEIRDIQMRINSFESAIGYKKEELKDEPGNTKEHMRIKDFIYNYMQNVKDLKAQLEKLEAKVQRKVASGGRTRRARKRKSTTRGRR
jgi:chromosome segregation ATPase